MAGGVFQFISDFHHLQSSFYVGIVLKNLSGISMTTKQEIMDSANVRRSDIYDLYVRLGSYTQAGKELGLSNGRVRQIVLRFERDRDREQIFDEKCVIND